jgi:hypothetical protein
MYVFWHYLRYVELSVAEEVMEAPESMSVSMNMSSMMMIMMTNLYLHVIGIRVHFNEQIILLRAD